MFKETWNPNVTEIDASDERSKINYNELYSKMKYSKVFYKRFDFKLVLVLICILFVYLFVEMNVSGQKATTDGRKTSKRLNAFIITSNCKSDRFNVTRENIERVFPNYFNIRCYLTIPLNDSRIHPSPYAVWKKFSSNLLTFIELWTFEIPKYSNGDDFQWNFAFEDDVNFIQPEEFSLKNFIEPLEELMYRSEVQYGDGFFYLGLCDPQYEGENKTVIAKNTNGTFYSVKTFGYCLHASAITTNRSRLFWTDVSSYRPSPGEESLDLHLRTYSVRSKNKFYLFGSCYSYPPQTGHYGVAFQDRGRFSTSILV